MGKRPKQNKIYKFGFTLLFELCLSTSIEFKKALQCQ